MKHPKFSILAIMLFPAIILALPACQDLFSFKPSELEAGLPRVQAEQRKI